MEKLTKYVYVSPREREFAERKSTGEEKRVGNSENPPDEASEGSGGSCPSGRPAGGRVRWLVQWGLGHVQKKSVENQLSTEADVL